MVKARPFHFVSVLLALCLFQSIASASISIGVTSPANGATVLPGASVYIEGSAMCSNNYLESFYIKVNGGTLYSRAFGMYDFTYYWLGSTTYTVPTNATPGSMITISFEATQYGETNLYYRDIYLFVGADTTAPTYSGTAGIKSVERVDGTSANVEWYQATDAVTSAANMRYRIYYDPVQANVFSSGVKKTVTGATSTTITGLTATSTYYVGVRAVDEAGNAETNTRTLLLGLPLNAAQPSWALYE